MTLQGGAFAIDVKPGMSESLQVGEMRFVHYFSDSSITGVAAFLIESREPR